MQEKYKSSLTGVALAGIVLAASLPLLTNYCIDAVNVGFYLRQLEQGGVSDLFLVLPGVLVRLGIPAEWIYRLLLFGCNVATAWIAWWAFEKMFQDRRIGLLGAMLYTWFPYRLGDLYSRGDLGEAMALCFLPLLLWALYALYTGDVEAKEYGRLWLFFTAGLTGILQTYLLTFLVTAGFVLLLCLVQWKKTFRRQTLRVLVLTAAATLVCNGWLIGRLLYLFKTGNFPATLERITSIQKGGLYLANYFQLFFRNGTVWQFAENGMREMEPLGIGFALCTGMLLCVGLLFVGIYRGKEKEDQKAGQLLAFQKPVLFTGFCFMVLSLNVVPWDAIGLKNRLFYVMTNCLQSPARLLPITALCFTFASCAGIWQIMRWEKAEIGKAAAIAMAVIAFVGAQYLTGDILRTGEPRSLYGVPYHQETEEPEVYAQGSLEISPLDYGKYESSNAALPKGFMVWEGITVLGVAAGITVLVWRKKRVEKV